ncbi:hypothetical protein Efla_001025 [Eimeria flavescens]
MAEPPDGHIAVFTQLLVRLRSIRASAVEDLLGALQQRSCGSGSPLTLDAFVEACNRRLECSGFQVVMGFDGEGPALSLRGAPLLEAPRGEQLQKTLHKLHRMGEAEACCIAGECCCLFVWSAVGLSDFVRLCAKHRVHSAPQLLRLLLELRWVAAEAAAAGESRERRLTLGPGFYLSVCAQELLPQLEGWALPPCAVCTQPALLQATSCSGCRAQCHLSCLNELRSSMQQQQPQQEQQEGEGRPALVCCVCGAASWEDRVSLSSQLADAQ